MTRLVYKVSQVVLVFLAAAAFYLLTAAFVPYPGLSTGYLAAICFPEATETLGTHLLDEWVTFQIVHLAGAERMILWTTLLSACCGGAFVALLFLAVKSTVHLSCLDQTGLRARELARAERDTRFIARISGVGAALLGLVSLPIWSMGTRLLPGSVTACAGMAFFALAIALRRFCAEDAHSGSFPAWNRRLMMGLLFALALFLGTLSPMLLPMAVAGILFGGWILVLPRIEGRVSYFPWIAGGIAAGLAASIGVSAAWHSVFNPEATLPAVLLWAQSLKGIAVTLIAMTQRFESLAPLVLFAAATALFFGTFPRAFLRFGTPLVGQLAIVALVVLLLLHWPAEFRPLLSEPDPLVMLGMAMTVMLAALLVGSWAKQWLDFAVRLKGVRTHLIALIGTAGLLGGLTAAFAVANCTAGAGLSARQALSPISRALAQVVPDGCTVWVDPPQNAALFLVHRYAAGSPVCPVREIDRVLHRLRLGGNDFVSCCAADPVLNELAAIGGAPLVQYLRFSDWGEGVLAGSPATAHAAQVEAVAAQVTETPFGRTPVGERFVRDLARQAARVYAAQANQTDDDAAAEPLLRKAKALDPENLGVRLSLGALADSGWQVSKSDELAAVDVLEKDPRLRAPTLKLAADFETQYGPVRSATFRAAARLRNFLENPEENVAAIVEAYRNTPDLLSDRERVIALLTLDEPSILAVFADREPSRAEIEAYLCFHLRTDASKACYKRYEPILRENDALSVLYRNRGYLSEERLHEKAYAFFARDGYFPYAYVYLHGLLRTGGLTEAATFVSGFSFREALLERPCLAEELRVRVLQTVALQDPVRAVSLAREWLHTEPAQPRIRTFLLNQTAAADGERFAADVRESLRYYPLHPVASAALAEELTRLHGAEAAARWVQSVARARRDVISQVEME